MLPFPPTALQSPEVTSCARTSRRRWTRLWHGSARPRSEPCHPVPLSRRRRVPTAAVLDERENASWTFSWMIKRYLVLLVVFVVLYLICMWVVHSVSVWVVLWFVTESWLLGLSNYYLYPIPWILFITHNDTIIAVMIKGNFTNKTRGVG